MTCPRVLRRSRPVLVWWRGAVGCALVAVAAVGCLTAGCTVDDESAASSSTIVADPAGSEPDPQAEARPPTRAEHVDRSAIKGFIRSQRRTAGAGDGSEAVVVKRAAKTVAVAPVGADARQLSLLLRDAYQALERVTGPQHTVLLAYWPASRASFDSLIGASPGSYDGIAAVTTSLDVDSGESLVAVVVNPDVFPTLRLLGRRVVIAHESAHAATVDGAAGMAAWLAEGFADYVGIVAVPEAAVRSRRAAARGVRRDGLPLHLPSDSAFATPAPHLNSTYAQSWLVVRLLAGRYGERRLVHFYDAVAADPDQLREALRDELGTTIRATTRLWRARLRGLADGG